MKNRLLFLLLLIAALSGAQAQFGSFGDVPIEIDAEVLRPMGDASNAYVAEGNVVLRYGTTTIYCDYAQYNPDTRDVLLRGNVRLYREGQLFTGERALYNLETKVLNAADFRGSFEPFRFAGDSLGTLGSNAYLVKGGVFTTSDSSKPDYHIRAKSVRIYQNDRVIFSNVMLYVGRTPIFWFPYVYQSLDKEQGFTLSPGYGSGWGAYLLTQYTFPLGDNWSGKLRLDLRSERGPAAGFESEWGDTTTNTTAAASGLGAVRTTTRREPRREGGSWGRFRSYAMHDANPGTNRTGLNREPVDSARYRVSLQSRTYLTEDIYASIDINKLSDARFLQDFEPGEFRRNPNPDNAISLTKWDEDYTLTLTGRKNLNEEHFDATERLPDLALDVKRQPLFGSRLFYEGETSGAFLRRNFAGDSLFQDYDTFRADSFHQILFPGTYFGWLSVVPRVGVRGTYYTDSGSFEDVTVTNLFPAEILGGEPRLVTTTERRLREGGSVFRPAVNAGVEASFKFSRAFEQVQSRMWGLDGLRHVAQPYMNASYVYSGKDPENILQFDRLNRSTQLPPLDFPQFNSIDSIDSWSIIRFGMRNRLQTRRNNATFNWLELDTFFDLNIDRPDFLGGVMPDEGTFSNVFNRLRWQPLPWVALIVDSQLPVLDAGFTEVNTNINFLVNRNVQLNLGHRYIEGNPLIFDSNLAVFGGYFQLGDNWGFSFREAFEFQDSTLESQRYELHRDLSSWVASLGFIVRDNRGVNDYGLLLTFTLKDLPSVRVPLAFDPEGTTTGGSGKNR